MKFSEKYNLIKKLIEKGFTQSQIADKLNMRTRQVTVFTSQHKLINNNKLQIELSENDKQVIIGSLLGDGYLDEYGRLRLKQSCKQLKYLQYKKDLLSPNIISNFKTETLKYDKRTLKNYCSCSLDTICTDSIKAYRNSWYKESKKLINIEDFKQIEPLGLSIWFMDDGFKYNKGISIATECYTIEDIKQMRNILLSKFDILFEISNKNRLYLKKKEYIKFHNLIESYIIPELRYKLQNI